MILGKNSKRLLTIGVCALFTASACSGGGVTVAPASDEATAGTQPAVTTNPGDQPSAFVPMDNQASMTSAQGEGITGGTPSGGAAPATAVPDTPMSQSMTGSSDDGETGSNMPPASPVDTMESNATMAEAMNSDASNVDDDVDMPTDNMMTADTSETEAAPVEPDTGTDGTGTQEPEVDPCTLQPEVCDGIDNNCNNVVDEGELCSGRICSRGQCVDCISESDCGLGTHCDTETNRCEQCTLDAHCTFLLQQGRCTDAHACVLDTPEATTEPTAQPLSAEMICRDLGGIAYETSCCSRICGTCGGNGCGDLPGGPDNCCIGYIQQSGASCDDVGSPPCEIPSSPGLVPAPQPNNDFFCTRLGGLVSGKACCPASCGSCGGDGCGARPGGQDCCTAAVLDSKRFCTREDPPCIIP